MGSVPINRARALIICTRPEAHDPTRVHEAASFLAARPDATEDEKRLAADAMAWIRGKRDEPKPATAPVKPKRKRKG
jgi:hypothetical protein